MMRVLFVLFLLAFAIDAGAAPARPPAQPAHGPGGADYAHAKVNVRELPGGARGGWLFTPDDPLPASVPVVVFCHGWGAMNPVTYRAWIDHIVRRGNIVIYPAYQDSLLTPAADFLPNAIAGIREALSELRRGIAGIRPDTTRFAVVGHSAGGVLAAELGATAREHGLPAFSAVMPVEPGDGSREGRRRASVPIVDLSPMPASTLFLVVVGADDHLAGQALGERLYGEAVQVPAANRNVIELESDHHGEPALIANHAAPSATLSGEPFPLPEPGTRAARWFNRPGRMHAGAVDALDWYGTWKLFDALTDAAFHGRDRAVALGGSPAQTSMGVWSDGVPVKPMRVLR